MKPLLAGSISIPPIHVVDDDEDMLYSLRVLLEGVGYTVCLHQDAAEFLECVEEPTGVLISDLRLRGLSGLGLQERVAHHEHLQIIFISGVAEVPDSVAAMKAGAHDFLIKPFREQVLLDAVASAMEKVAAVSARVASYKETQRNFELLTDTERHIARLVATGLRNKEIAYMTAKTENTVKVHRSRVMHKMGVNSAYALMLRLQLLGTELGQASPA